MVYHGLSWFIMVYQISWFIRLTTWSHGHERMVRSSPRISKELADNSTIPMKEYEKTLKRRDGSREEETYLFQTVLTLCKVKGLQTFKTCYFDLLRFSSACVLAFPSLSTWVLAGPSLVHYLVHQVILPNVPLGHWAPNGADDLSWSRCKDQRAGKGTLRLILCL